MNPQEQLIYNSVYAAVVQGIYANGYVISRPYGAASYHPDQKRSASEAPGQVHSQAHTQAMLAVDAASK